MLELDLGSKSQANSMVSRVYGTEKSSRRAIMYVELILEAWWRVYFGEIDDIVRVGLRVA